MSIKLKPLEDKIIVKQAEAETQTASGLFIPDNAKEKPQQGEVLAVGPGRRDDKGERIPMDVQVGDKVLYSKYGGTEVRYEGEDYLIVAARDILAILG
ncbi:co-chaperone GroES [Bifidobacterium samirii]|uniref:Co-chaperonin GroES n=1 Tax=Bifidobacterium samirii TaxID=2306974 RepID=A0A430FDY2_9BIFI|nr:co-chaperone GroES [Bifidobacterium samirii]RSX51027.1 molecular chaperone GroES [Bifidobacterium samirii]